MDARGGLGAVHAAVVRAMNGAVAYVTNDGAAICLAGFCADRRACSVTGSWLDARRGLCLNGRRRRNPCSATGNETNTHKGHDEQGVANRSHDWLRLARREGFNDRLMT